MSAPSTSGLSVELLLQVIDVKYGYFTLLLSYLSKEYHDFNDLKNGHGRYIPAQPKFSLLPDVSYPNRRLIKFINISATMGQYPPEKHAKVIPFTKMKMRRRL